MDIQYQSNLPYLTKVQCDISDIPLVQNKDYQYEASEVTSKSSKHQLNATYAVSALAGPTLCYSWYRIHLMLNESNSAVVYSLFIAAVFI